MFRKDGFHLDIPGGHGKGVLLTDRNAAGHDLPFYKVIALRRSGRQGDLRFDCRGSRGRGRGIVRSALYGHSDIVNDCRPLRVKGGSVGYSIAVKIIRSIQTAVAVPAAKGIACFGRGWRLCRFSVLSNDLLIYITAAVCVKGNGICWK